MCRITNITPAGNDTVQIEAVNNDNRIYGFDDAEAPLLPVNDNAVVDNPIPVVESIVVIADPTRDGFYQASWTPAQSASQYILEVSYDGINFDPITTTPSITHFFTLTTIGEVYVRVAGVNAGIGPYAIWNGSLGIASEPPAEVSGLLLVTPFIGSAVNFQWNASASAVEYILQITINGQTIEIVTSATSHIYTNEQALIDFGANIGRSMGVAVVARNTAGETPPLSSLVINNPPPAIPSNVVATITSQTADILNIRADWDANTDPDFKEFLIYASDVSGFTPDTASKVAQGTGNFAAFMINNINQPSIYYRIEAVDVWGQTQAQSITDELELVLPV